MSNKNPTQCDRVIAYLKEYKTINQHEATRDLGIARLASRINELRVHHPISSEMITVRNRFDEKTRIAQYRIDEDIKTH